MKICIKYEQLKLGDEHDYECDYYCGYYYTHIVVTILNYAVYKRSMLTAWLKMCHFDC